MIKTPIVLQDIFTLYGCCINIQLHDKSMYYFKSYFHFVSSINTPPSPPHSTPVYEKITMRLVIFPLLRSSRQKAPEVPAPTPTPPPPPPPTRGDTKQNLSIRQVFYF